MMITLRSALFLAGCITTFISARPTPSPFLGLPSPFKLPGLPSSGGGDSDKDNDSSSPSLLPAIPPLPPLVNINNNKGDETHQSDHVDSPQPLPPQAPVQNFYHKEINNNKIHLSSSSSSSSSSNDQYVERPNYSFFPRPGPVNHQHYYGRKRLATMENSNHGQRKYIHRFKVGEDCDDLCTGNAYEDGEKQSENVLRVSLNAH